MHDTTPNWEYLAKNLNDINVEVIADKTLLRLGIHILAIVYLEEKVLYFTKVIGNNKGTNQEVKIVSDSEEEIKIKKALCKEKKEA